MENTWHADQEKPELRPDEKPLNCPFCGSDSICTDSSHYGEPDEDGSIARMLSHGVMIVDQKALVLGR